MSPFDLVIRGGVLVDGSGEAAREADVGMVGDRIAAIGDLRAVDPASVPLLLEIPGRVVAPGFVDPHGHSDASVLVDGALVSHLRQGFTTQVSGNCGDSLAPLTAASEPFVRLLLGWAGVPASWTTFGEYLAAVDAQPLGPNVGFLVGHGTIRGAVLGPASRAANEHELAAMERHLDEALDAGAFGLSSGLIYAPGMHAPATELSRLVARTARRGGLYATHIRNESAGLFAALEEALATARAAGDQPRLQVSHLKVGARALWGLAGAAVERLEAARADGVDVAADQYPYPAAATTLATILPSALLAQPVDDIVRVLADAAGRRRVRDAIDAGESSWENVTIDPGWAGIRMSGAPSHPDWAGHDLAELGRKLGCEPANVAFDALVDDRLEVDILVECMTEADIETILAVPWIAVCTDATARRPDDPVLGAGVPHPRTYGTTAQILGRYVRERAALPLETAIAKLTSVPAARIGLPDRGVVREGAFADLVVFDPATVADLATPADPARHPAGIEHVVVNGIAAVLDGGETGRRAGRLLRRDG